MLVLAGSYERFLLGFEVVELTQDSGKLQRVFTHAAHQKAVKCMAAGGPFIATGGADDQIHLYDMRDRKDLGFLMNPGEGAVPCMEFYSPAGAVMPSHLFSGSADGLICVWKAGGGWEHLKKLGGHQGSVNSLTVHTTGRVALSVGHDQTLRMWNLVKGRLTYTAKLDIEADTIKFSPSGTSYNLLAGPKITVHSTSGEGQLLASLQPERRPISFLQHHDDALLMGAEDGSLQLWDVRTGKIQQRMDRAHTARVRAIAAFSGGDAATSCLPLHITSASSDGVIKLWDSRMMAQDGSMACLGQAATNARITCLCTWQPQAASSTAAPVARPDKLKKKRAAKHAHSSKDEPASPADQERPHDRSTVAHDAAAGVSGAEEGSRVKKRKRQHAAAQLGADGPAGMEQVDDVDDAQRGRRPEKAQRKAGKHGHGAEHGGAGSSTPSQTAAGSSPGEKQNKPGGKQNKAGKHRAQTGSESHGGMGAGSQGLVKSQHASANGSGGKPVNPAKVLRRQNQLVSLDRSGSPADKLTKKMKKSSS